MAARQLRPPDPDDWFAEPALTRRSGDDSAAAVEGDTDDDWPEAVKASSSSWPGRSARQLTTKRIAIAGVCALALLLLGLAAAGLFSGGRSHPAAPAPATSAPATASAPAATSVRPPARTLKPGDQGAQVRALQRALASLGYAPGKIDGSYGPATQKAVRAYQRASRLTADGLLGPKTLAALTKTLAGSG